MLHFHKTNEFIGKKNLGGYLRIIPCMFYMIGRRLNNSILTHFMHTHVFFLFCHQCWRTFPCFSWSLVNRKITSYLLIFTKSLWLHVKHFIALTKRESGRRFFFCNYRSGLPLSTHRPVTGGVSTYNSMHVLHDWP
jgi:hypothetical protein